MLSSALKAIISGSARRPRLVLLLSALLAVIAAIYAVTHFDMTTDTSDLIAPSVSWRQDSASLSAAFPKQDGDMVIVVDGQTAELASDGAARLATALAEDHAHFFSASQPEGGDFFKREGLLFGSLDDVRAQTERLVAAQPLLGGLAQDPSLRGIANTLAVAASPDAADNEALDQLEPAFRQIDGAISSTMAGKPSFFSWQQLFSPTKGDLIPPTRQIVSTQPKLDFTSLQPGENAVAAVHAKAAALHLDPTHGVAVGVTGEVPLSDEEFGSLEENIGLVGAIMLAALLLALWFATRSAKTVMAIVATTAAGLVLTSATGLLAVGTFNLISVAFIPLFVGLGVDFGIQVSVRFNAERLTGATPLAALAAAAERIGEPLLIAAAAIFLGFGAFLPTDYVGIAQLGIISGIGIVIALVLNITLLPALLILFNPAVPDADVGFARAAPVDRWLAANRRSVLGGFGVAMLASLVLLPFVTFDFNPLHLRDPNAPAMRLLTDLTRDPRFTPNNVAILAPDIASANRLAARLAALPEVDQAVTVDSFIPADQPAKLALIEDASLLLDPAINPFEPAAPPDDAANAAALVTTSSQLADFAAQQPGRLANSAAGLAATFDRLAKASPAMRQRVEAMLVAPLNITLDQLRFSIQATAVSRDDLPPDVAGDWIARDGRALIRVFPSGNSKDNAVLERFTKAVRAVAPHATGAPVETQEAARTVAQAFIKAGVLAFVLISLLLFAVLRSLRQVADTLAPVVLSGFLTLDTCVIIGQSLNFANIIAFPLLLGVGVAFHIYFVMAWRNGTRDLLQTPLTRAVIFSALATGSAFGALWLSDHPGTASMGLILMISLVWTLVCALIFEPALLGSSRRPTSGA